MSYQNEAFFWCGVLEPHGCVLLSEDVSFDYKANKIARDDTLRSSTSRAHGQAASCFLALQDLCSAPIRKRANSFEARPRSARELSRDG